MRPFFSIRLTNLVAGTLALLCPALCSASHAAAAPVAFAPVSSGVVRVNTPAQKLSVPLNGARDLYLVATYGGDSYDYDQALWGEPTLITAGGRRVPLTTLKPASARVGWGELLVNRSHTGGVLETKNRSFAHGFWAHAPSVLHFKLDGKTYTHFETFAGLSPSAERGSVVFQVRADAGGRYPSAAEFKGRKNGSKPKVPSPVIAAGQTKFVFNPEAAERLRAAGVNEVLFIRRVTFTANHVYTDYINSRWAPGGGLCALDLRTGKVREIASEFTKNGVVNWFDLSFDAQKIVFDFKAAPNEGYRIYEVNVDGSGVRQITYPPADESALVAKFRRGYHHGTDDMDPCYLPDGGIAFTSTRAQFGVLCDSSDCFTVKNLHRVERDGSGLRRLTYSPLSEATPTLLPDGRILYHRWEYVDKAAGNCKALWAMNPDGSASAEIYGNTITFPETKIQARAIPNSSKLVMLGASHWINNAVGSVVLVDPSKGIRNQEAMHFVSPEVAAFAHDGFHFKDAAGKWVYNRDGKPGRLFREPFPLSENLFITARKNKGLHWATPDGYDLALLDGAGNDTLLLDDPGVSLWHPYPLVKRTPPRVAAPAIVDEQLAAKNLARCIVTDVYEGMENVRRGDVKYLRILEQLPRPWSARRDGNGNGMAHIAIGDGFLSAKVQHGVVPVEADGSAHFLVPAGRAIYLQALDGNYRAIQTERTYVNYNAGEVRSCIGCHETADVTPASSRRAGKPLALQRPASVPAAQPEQTGAQVVFDFARQIQPVLDRHCVGCHSANTGNGEKSRLNLSGDDAGVFSTSYNALIRLARDRSKLLLGTRSLRNEDAASNDISYIPPYKTGAFTSPLAALIGAVDTAHVPAGAKPYAERLVSAHTKLKLSPAERLTLTNWLDLNCPFHPSYWGAKNIKFKGRADYRPQLSFAEHCATTPPAITENVAAK